MKQDYQNNVIQRKVNKEFIEKCKGIFSDCNSSIDIQRKFNISKGAVLAAIKKSNYDEEKFTELIETKSTTISKYITNKNLYKNNIGYIGKLLEEHDFSEEEKRQIFNHIKINDYKFTSKRKIEAYIINKYRLKRNRIILRELSSLSNQNYDSLRRNIYNNFGPQIFLEKKGLSKKNIEKIIEYINTRVVRNSRMDLDVCPGKQKRFSIFPYKSLSDASEKNNVSRSVVEKIYKESNSSEEFLTNLKISVSKISQLRTYKYKVSQIVQDICEKYKIDYTKVGDLALQYFMNKNNLNLEKFLNNNVSDNIDKLELYLYKYAKKNSIFIS